MRSDSEPQNPQNQRGDWDQGFAFSVTMSLQKFGFLTITPKVLFLDDDVNLAFFFGVIFPWI